MRTQLTSNNSALQIELDAVKVRLDTASQALDDSKRFQSIRLDDVQRQYRRELEETQNEAGREARRQKREHDDEIDDLRRTLEDALENERRSHEKHIEALTSQEATTQQEKQTELENQAKAFERLADQLKACQNDLDQERASCAGLRTKTSELTSNIANLEHSVQRLEGHIHFLESDNKSQSQAFADLEARMQAALRSAAEANDKLRTEETLRRKLHNQVQELKGNIRVFCRVRPSLEGDRTESAKISYPDDETDSKEVEIMGAEEKSSLGNITTKKHPFSFDRVFGPRSQNQDVFGEISQLVQSALDGYNVCIFCYGQTGSGKTYTMSASDGMIPLATNQIYQTATSLEEKGWNYKMEGSYLEVYNEVLNDLLGKADELDKKKHEIKHDMTRGKTTITDITTVILDSPSTVESILSRASKNRSVASTKSNERSSRSHSVFILKLIGENSITGEKSEGTLNLVDLAGSERVSQSGVTGERLKETQSINKSLSCLSDVIGALGQGKEGGHVPYRNSKLTYLLQNSLGGNSKTLMFVMISPLQAHLSETLTSLKFATKVFNTHIGTAKKQTKT
ncbi:kinesin family member C1, partial [Lecanoromycetidae sp. Uapishka_2]